MKKTISILISLTLIIASIGVFATAYADSPKKITLSKTSKTVYIGQKYKLKVKAVTPKKANDSVKWKTSDKKIATIDKNGVIKGIKKGTVTITAVSRKNKNIKAKCKVTIKKFKKTSIDYKSKVLSSDYGYTVIGPEFDNHQDTHIIKTYNELKALKKRIKKHYDVELFYSDTSPFYNDETYLEKNNGDEILEILDKYNKKFFKTKVLYYNCIDFSTETDGYDIDYDFKCTNVKKSITSKGKLTCYMYVKRSVNKIKKSEYDIDDDTVCYFIELNKKDINGVQDYKVKHYEYFDLKHIDVYGNIAKDQ